MKPLFKLILLVTVCSYTLSGCNATALTDHNQQSVVTIERCQDLQRNLKLPQKNETTYRCGKSGHGALVSKSPYLGSDGKLHKSPQR